MKLYYIEKKTLSKITEFEYHQYSDVGILPMLYTSKDKALRKAQRLTDYLKENCRYDVTLETEEISSLKTGCLYAARLKEYHSSFYVIVRVYEVNTL